VLYGNEAQNYGEGSGDLDLQDFYFDKLRRATGSLASYGAFEVIRNGKVLRKTSRLEIVKGLGVIRLDWEYVDGQSFTGNRLKRFFTRSDLNEEYAQLDNTVEMRDDLVEVTATIAAALHAMLCFACKTGSVCSLCTINLKLTDGVMDFCSASVSDSF